MTRLERPSGSPPPDRATLPEGEAIDLVPLADEVTARYFGEFPDDLDRYGELAREWCAHDNRHILAWAVDELGGHPILAGQVRWLGRVLAARGYPLERLARNLELAGAVLAERLPERRPEVEAMFARSVAHVAEAD